VVQRDRQWTSGAWVAERHGCGGGLPDVGLYPCQGGQVPVGVSLKWSGEVGDPYPQSCRDQDGPGEGLRRWPIFFGLWRRRELGLAVLRGRAFTNRV
jgi:hypothetical protein